MIKWLKLLFHFHQWETFDEGKIFNSKNHIIGNYYLQKCKVCGKYQRVEV